ncbi:MAG TPA: CvpA family protein [Blastocatellia bacterium]|nr:CvpA family protein [Blastocatellia bacterium]
MTLLDYLVLVVVALSVTSGAVRGILKGTISLISALVGLISAAYLYRFVTGFASLFVSSVQAAELLAFIAIFVIVVAAGAVISYKLRRSIKGGPLSLADHALGALFGLLRAWLICSAVYLGLIAFPVKIEAVGHARFAPLLVEGTRVISYLTSPEVREQFLIGYTKIKELSRQERK